jgi:hypothetical protein
MQKKVNTLVEEVIHAKAGETAQTEWHKAKGNRRVARATQGSQAARDREQRWRGEGGEDRTRE